MRIKAWGMILFLISLGLWLSPIHPSHAATPSVTPPPNIQVAFTRFRRLLVPVPISKPNRLGIA